MVDPNAQIESPRSAGQSGANSAQRLLHTELVRSRREFLTRAGCGFGGLALASLLAGERTARANVSIPHAAPRARHVIFLFMEGGPSHLDTFDRKPRLTEMAGQVLPESFGPLITAMGEVRSPLLAPRRTWRRHGEAGIWISDWLPHLATQADELCVLQSCWADGLNHVGSVCQMNTGSVLAGRPSLGSWVSYGLGSVNQNLPSFVVLCDRENTPLGGVRNWGSGFMPATFQGTRLQEGDDPIPHLASPPSQTPQRISAKARMLQLLNRRHAADRGDPSELEARIQSYELAFRMQMQAPEAVDLSRETASVQQSYGLHDKSTAAMARCCLLARRLVERGVTFVQVYCGAGSAWDAHSKIEQNHSRLCRGSDRPIAALLADLKQRGLLEQTLVVWGGEFGRTPMSEQGHGRDHNPYGFTMWLAGGGARGGQVIGATDELGLRAVQNPIHVHDLHATILASLGLEAQELTFSHQGRRENPTINSGSVVDQVFGG